MSFLHHPALTSLALGAVLSALPTTAQLYNKTIKTDSGPVQGFKYFNQSTLEEYFNISDNNVAAFLGIPYAADTAYQNRWKPPQPRDPWNETLIADSFGPACPSSYVTVMSEDCLSLNIWTGANSSDDKLPVMVWNQGSDETSDNAMWYGGGMAMKGVVVVTFNCRDDVFGFLSHPELNAESLVENCHNSSGNYGILDHLALLKWVQRNIASFGGDPDRVTIAGQSFGSAQVYHAVNSELFKGLFVGAIPESDIRYPYDTLVAGLATSYVAMPTALNFGLNYTSFHNVSTAAELRNLSTADLLIGSQDRDYNYSYITALSTDYPLIFKPVLDDYVLPKTYIQTLFDGPPNNVPLITGNTKDESGASTSTNFTVTAYLADCKLKYGNLSEEYFKLYPTDNYASTTDRSWNAAARDTSLISSWLYANDWVKSASSPIYTYYWDHAPPGQDQGAYHQSEIFYIMDSLYASAESFPWTWQSKPNLDGSYKSNNSLAYWSPNDGKSPNVFRVGQAFENQTIAQPAQVSLVKAYFAQQTPY